MSPEDSLKQPPRRMVEAASRPDSKLPVLLRHESIRAVRERHGLGVEAYEIEFDQHWLPWSYRSQIGDEWRIIQVVTEFEDRIPVLGKLLPGRPYLKIGIEREVKASD